jgi:hypothetical protein
MRPLLGNPALKPGSVHITRAVDHFEEMLAIRKSANLFRLRSAEEIQAKVRFFNTGPSQIPGLIVMNLRDEQATDGITDIVVLFNANDETQTFRLPQYAGRPMAQHPMQVYSSNDPIVRQAMFAELTGEFTVPGRTTAVFINAPSQPGDGGTDGGDIDAGSPVDAGTGYDGGFEYDAGTGYDGGYEYDAGMPVDAGTGSDAGTDPEPTDAGTGSDAGTDPVPTDAGTGSDAGTEPEPADSGTTTDAGTQPTDAGTTPGTDAGTQPTDAGTNPGTDAGTGNGGGNDGGGCGGCAGTGGEAFSALALLLGGVMQSRRRRRA